MFEWNFTHLSSKLKTCQSTCSMLPNAYRSRWYCNICCATWFWQHDFHSSSSYIYGSMVLLSTRVAAAYANATKSSWQNETLLITFLREFLLKKSQVVSWSFSSRLTFTLTFRDSSSETLPWGVSTRVHGSGLTTTAPTRAPCDKLTPFGSESINLWRWCLGLFIPGVLIQKWISNLSRLFEPPVPPQRLRKFYQFDSKFLSSYCSWSVVNTFKQGRQAEVWRQKLKRLFLLFLRFLLQCLEDLDANLRKLNSRLFVIRGQPANVFPRLFKVSMSASKCGFCFRTSQMSFLVCVCFRNGRSHGLPLSTTRSLLGRREMLLSRSWQWRRV